MTPTTPTAIAPSLIRPGIVQPMPKYPHEVLQNIYSNPETVCEAAARILFMSVKWAKNVPAFVSLPFQDQLTLLEESWRELFVLGAAQFCIPLEAAPLLAAAGLTPIEGEDDAGNPDEDAADSAAAAPESRRPSGSSSGGEGVSAEKYAGMTAELRAFQDIIAKFQALQVDPTEYACLKGIVLFKTVFSETSESADLRDLRSVSSLQDQAQLILSKYICATYPSQPFRFGKLLLLLPSLRTINSNTIEEVFFRKTIGAIPIQRLLCDMYKSSDF
jgi:nuclear receptor subfamily 2 group E protein 1